MGTLTNTEYYCNRCHQKEEKQGVLTKVRIDKEIIVNLDVHFCPICLGVLQRLMEYFFDGSPIEIPNDDYETPLRFMGRDEIAKQQEDQT